MTNLESLTWWRNYQMAALARLKTSKLPAERDALHAIATDTSAMVVMYARRLEDEAKVAQAEAMGVM